MKVLQVVWKMHEKGYQFITCVWKIIKRNSSTWLWIIEKCYNFSLPLKNLDKDVAARQIYGKLWEAIEKWWQFYMFIEQYGKIFAAPYVYWKLWKTVRVFQFNENPWNEVAVSYIFSNNHGKFICFSLRHFSRRGVARDGAKRPCSLAIKFCCKFPKLEIRNIVL